MRVGTPDRGEDEAEPRAKPTSLRKRVALSLWQRWRVSQMRRHLRKAGFDGTIG